MESGGIFRTIILMGLFLVLVCDYSSLIVQMYQSLNGSINGSRSFFEEDDGRSSRSAVSVLRNPSTFREDKQNIDLDADVDFNNLNLFGGQSRSEVLETIKNACLPKLICELSAGGDSRRFTESEKSLLKLISDTSLGTMAEVTSKYHFAAHMGQLISGIDGTGCHNFYSSCPLPGMQVLQMLKEVRMR